MTKPLGQAHEGDRTALRVRTITPFADEHKAEQEAHAERAAERMRKLNADPEFAKANAERMRKLNADPEFAKANAAAVSVAQKKRWAAWRRKRGRTEGVSR